VCVVAVDHITAVVAADSISDNDLHIHSSLISTLCPIIRS
jgi:hypothetical protein